MEIESVDELRNFRCNMAMVKWPTTGDDLSRKLWLCDARDHAARSGNLGMLKFVYKTRMESCMSAQAATKAMRNWGASKVELMDGIAGHGLLDVMQFLCSHRIRRYSAISMDNAAANGHLDVV